MPAAETAHAHAAAIVTQLSPIVAGVLKRHDAVTPPRSAASSSPGRKGLSGDSTAVNGRGQGPKAPKHQREVIARLPSTTPASIVSYWRQYKPQPTPMRATLHAEDQISVPADRRPQHGTRRRTGPTDVGPSRSASIVSAGAVVPVQQPTHGPRQRTAPSPRGPNLGRSAPDGPGRSPSSRGSELQESRYHADPAALSTGLRGPPGALGGRGSGLERDFMDQAGNERRQHQREKKAEIIRTLAHLSPQSAPRPKSVDQTRTSTTPPSGGRGGRSPPQPRVHSDGVDTAEEMTFLELLCEEFCSGAAEKAQDGRRVLFEDQEGGDTFATIRRSLIEVIASGDLLIALLIACGVEALPAPVVDPPETCYLSKEVTICERVTAHRSTDGHSPHSEDRTDAELRFVGTHTLSSVTPAAAAERIEAAMRCARRVRHIAAELQPLHVPPATELTNAARSVFIAKTRDYMCETLHLRARAQGPRAEDESVVSTLPPLVSSDLFAAAIVRQFDADRAQQGIADFSVRELPRVLRPGEDTPNVGEDHQATFSSDRGALPHLMMDQERLVSPGWLAVLRALAACAVARRERESAAVADSSPRPQRKPSQNPTAAARKQPPTSSPAAASPPTTKASRSQPLRSTSSPADRQKPSDRNGSPKTDSQPAPRPQRVHETDTGSRDFMSPPPRGGTVSPSRAGSAPYGRPFDQGPASPAGAKGLQELADETTPFSSRGPSHTNERDIPYGALPSSRNIPAASSSSTANHTNHATQDHATQDVAAESSIIETSFDAGTSDSVRYGKYSSGDMSRLDRAVAAFISDLWRRPAPGPTESPAVAQPHTISEDAMVPVISPPALSVTDARLWPHICTGEAIADVVTTVLVASGFPDVVVQYGLHAVARNPTRKAECVANIEAVQKALLHISVETSSSARRQRSVSRGRSTSSSPQREPHEGSSVYRMPSPSHLSKGSLSTAADSQPSQRLIAPFFLRNPDPVLKGNASFMVFLFEDIMRLADNVACRQHIPRRTDRPWLGWAEEERFIAAERSASVGAPSSAASPSASASASPAHIDPRGGGPQEYQTVRRGGSVSPRAVSPQSASYHAAEYYGHVDDGRSAADGFYPEESPTAIPGQRAPPPPPTAGGIGRFEMTSPQSDRAYGARHGDVEVSPPTPVPPREHPISGRHRGTPSDDSGDRPPLGPPSRGASPPSRGVSPPQTADGQGHAKEHQSSASDAAEIVFSRLPYLQAPDVTADFTGTLAALQWALLVLRKVQAMPSAGKPKRTAGKDAHGRRSVSAERDSPDAIDVAVASAEGHLRRLPCFASSGAGSSPGAKGGITVEQFTDPRYASRVTLDVLDRMGRTLREFDRDHRGAVLEELGCACASLATDGVAISEVVRVASYAKPGSALGRVNPHPKTPAVRRQNVAVVLRFIEHDKGQSAGLTSATLYLDGAVAAGYGRAAVFLLRAVFRAYRQYRV